MNTFRAHVLGLASLFFVVNIFGCAPTLSGSVRSIDGNIYVTDDARINVTSLSVLGEKSVTTLIVEKNGCFSTREPLPEGEYLVEALLPGYAISSQKIRIGPRADPVLFNLQKSLIKKNSSIRANIRIDQDRGAGGATLMPPSI